MTPDRSFAELGWVSVWLAPMSLEGVPREVVQGGDEVLVWLATDFDLEIDAAFSTHCSDGGAPVGIAALLRPLYASKSFLPPALDAAEAASLERASFAAAIYDVAYRPEVVGLDEVAPPAVTDEPRLIFLGAFPFEHPPPPPPPEKKEPAS